MANILDTIADHNRLLVAEKRRSRPLSAVADAALAMGADTGFPFARALAAPGMSFICEVKKASPSKGLIAPEFPYVEIAQAYEAAGASAVSCLTEPKWFLGRDEYVTELKSAISLPVLRKDFTIDEYMVYEAKTLGADAILLICALLNDRQLRDWRELAETLGMSALVEAHDEDEVRRALATGAGIIGVNNRNLKDFSVDVHNSARFRALIPEGVLFVSESGIRTRQDVAALEEIGADAVLIGETLMRAPDKKRMLDALRGVDA